jgi:hypothetical protein
VHDDHEINLRMKSGEYTDAQFTLGQLMILRCKSWGRLSQNTTSSVVTSRQAIPWVTKMKKPIEMM